MVGGGVEGEGEGGGSRAPLLPLTMRVVYHLACPAKHARQLASLALLVPSGGNNNKYNYTVAEGP